MVLKTALLGGLLVAGHASAKVNALFQRSEDIENVLRRDAEGTLVATLTERGTPDIVMRAPQFSSSPASGDASQANLNAWENQTQAACQSALTTLNGQASNPSGLAVCYNLPFLDNTTGVFEAELRMYNISAPIDPWTGVQAADIQMSLEYLGATVQQMNGTFAKRDLTWPPIRAEVDGLLIEKRQSTGSSVAPSELKVLMYVGKINSNLMGTAMTQSQLQPLLIPQINLQATSPKTNQQVTTTLSSTEASFVNGVFAKQATTTENPAAAASASALAATASVFVIPGTKLAFFPTGLVVTCVWTGLFFLAVGGGTVGRIQFRDQYRRRMKREVAEGMRTI